MWAPICEFDTTTLRFEYTSMKTPLSIYDYDMATRAKTLLKREEVLGGFDTDNYVTERLYAPAPDGTEIPMSIALSQGHGTGTAKIRFCSTATAPTASASMRRLRRRA